PPAERALERVARAVENEPHRRALLRGELADPVALGHRAEPDRAAEHAEVLGARDRSAPIDLAEARDERIRGDVFAADQRADLEERTRIEQVLDPLARIEIAAPMQQARD